MPEIATKPPNACDRDNCQRTQGYYGHQALRDGVVTETRCWYHSNRGGTPHLTITVVELTPNGGARNRRIDAHDEDGKLIGAIEITILAGSDERADILSHVIDSMLDPIEHGGMF